MDSIIILYKSISDSLFSMKDIPKEEYDKDKAEENGLINLIKKYTTTIATIISTSDVMSIY